VAASASGFGLEVRKEIVTPLLNGGRALWLELMAAFGPMGVRILLEKTMPQRPPAPLPVPQPVETSAESEIAKLLARVEISEPVPVKHVDAQTALNGGFSAIAWHLFFYFPAGYRNLLGN
jgi:hypothetical protein